MAQYLEAIGKSVIEGDMTGVSKGVQAALEAEIDAGEILQASLIPAMGEVGRLFEEGEYYVPEMLVAARAVEALADYLERHPDAIVFGKGEQR